MKLVYASVACCAAAIGFSQDPLRNEKAAVEADPRSSVAHFRLAEAYLLEKRLQPAANEFRESLSGDLTPRWTKVWAHINLAKIFTAAGDCARAATEYDLAYSTDDDAFGAQHEVEEYLRLHTVRPAAKLPDLAGESELPAGVHRAGPDVVAPVARERTQPAYSEAARLAGLEGTVLLEVTVAADGSATTVRVTRPLGLGLDANAMDAVRQWRFTPGLYRGRPSATLTEVAVDFRLPARPSRWHLVGVTFFTPTGVSDPAFAKAELPAGPGVARADIDDAMIANAVGRSMGATISFDVDETGAPLHVQVRKSSGPVWGTAAVALAQSWRFKPAEKDGMAVSVPVRVDLVWGERNLTQSPLPVLQGLTRLEPQRAANVACGTVAQ
jgi:TonB family protein